MLISIKDPENARQPSSILGPQSAEAIPVSSVRRCRFALIMLRSMIVIKNQAGLSRLSFFSVSPIKPTAYCRMKKLLIIINRTAAKSWSRLSIIPRALKGVRYPINPQMMDEGKRARHKLEPSCAPNARCLFCLRALIA